MKKIIFFLFLIVCVSTAYSQEIKKITLQKSVKGYVETNFCNDGKLGILIFYSTIENLNFEVVYPKTAIKSVTYQKENSRYVLCVEPTNEQNSNYKVKIYTAGYETTYCDIDDLSPKEQKIFEIIIGNEEYVILKDAGLMVQKTDITSGADWRTAKKMCSKSRVGGFSDWRMLTKAELAVLFEKRNIIGSFSDRPMYWSSSGGNDFYWYQNFNSGHQSNAYYIEQYRCRAVRTYKD